MKRILLLVPFLGLSAFGGYYHHWKTEFNARVDTIARDPLAVYRYRDGQADATADLARGKRRLIIHGTPPADQPEYTNLLDRIYHLQVQSIAPNPTPEVKRYVAAYNAVMEQDLAASFGRDTLTETRAIAQRRHELNEHAAAR